MPKRCSARVLASKNIRPDTATGACGNCCTFAARIAAAVGDAPALRDWLQRFDRVAGNADRSGSPRLCPVAGLQGALAELEGRRDEALAHWHDVLAHEEAADLFAQAGEVRIRMASIALNARRTRRGGRSDTSAASKR